MTAENVGTHHVVRDGSHWLCLHCRTTWPYPRPIAQLPKVPCVPKKWSE
jgi:hypothetical protein